MKWVERSHIQSQGCVEALIQSAIDGFECALAWARVCMLSDSDSTWLVQVRYGVIVGHRRRCEWLCILSNEWVSTLVHIRKSDFKWEGRRGR